MSTEAQDTQKSSGTQFSDVGDYEYRFTEHATHVWEHPDTGLHVEMHRRAGLQDGYGNVEKGYSAIARDADGDVVDELCGSSFGGHLPNKQDARRVVGNWLRDHADGELQGDEEVQG